MDRDRRLDEFFGGGGDDGEATEETNEGKAAEETNDGERAGGDDSPDDRHDAATGTAAASEHEAGTVPPGTDTDGTETAESDSDGGDEGGHGDDRGNRDSGDDRNGVGSAVVSTYRWTPDRADCAACGASVERLWRDDGRFVCDDCKEW